MSEVFTGDVDFLLDGGAIGITKGTAAPDTTNAVVHILNDNAATSGLRVASLWEGSTDSPFVNNDTCLFATYNKTLSDSANYSWAASCSNNYQNIPVGVTDSGERVGVIGWAGSVALTDYVHAGRLETQTGVKGTAGFQGAGSAATAVVGTARGVQGRINSDSAGATIEVAHAGSFSSVGGAGTIQTNVAVYARAENGTAANYSFYGERGTLFNYGPASFDIAGGGFNIGALGGAHRIQVIDNAFQFIDAGGSATGGVFGALRCSSLRIDQSPVAETVTCTHTITIAVDGTNYKIPCILG